MSRKKDKKEDNSLKTVLIVLGILIVFYCGGYYIGTHLTPEQVKDKRYISRPNKEVEYSGDEEKVVHLMNHLTSGMDCWNIEEYAKNDKVTSADLSNERIFHVIEASSLLPNNVESITLDDFLLEVNKYFGEGYSFDPEQIDYDGKDCFAYQYDSSLKTFKKRDTACGGTCGPNSSRYKITSAVEKDDVLRIYVRVLFGSQAEDIKYYSDYDRTNFVTDDYEHLSEYYGDGGSYLFTFHKVDGYYVFVSSELI